MAVAGPNNTTIYTSVTQKLRKERGQNLDTFITTFMQSVEQSTDLGEDVAEQNRDTPKGIAQRKITPPGRNLVFGDLFEMKKSTTNLHAPTTASQWSNGIQGPSKCLIYICK